MRRKGREELQICLKLVFRQASVIVYRVEQGHKLGYRRVVLHSLDVKRDLLHRLVEDALKLRSSPGALYHVGKSSRSVDKALAALHAVFAPRSGRGVVAHEEDIYPQHVGAVLVNNIVRVNNISL